MKLMKRLVYVAVVAAIGVAAYEMYRPGLLLWPLPAASVTTQAVQETIIPLKPVETILVEARTFTPQESLGYLGKDVITCGYRPLYVVIENNSERFVKFSLQDLSLKITAPELVAQRVYENTTGRAVGWGIAGIFLPILWIPGIIYTSRAYKANQRTLDAFMAKSLSDQIIAPRDRLEGLIFVHMNDYRMNWSMILTDQESGARYTCHAPVETQGRSVYTL